MIEPILFFILISSLLNLLYVIFIFLRALLQTPSQKMVLSGRTTLLFGLSISYILTFILNYESIYRNIQNTTLLKVY